MDKYISVRLEPEHILDFYDACRDVLNPEKNEDAVYDCTKIEVSNERFDILESYHLNKGGSKDGFAMQWVWGGPKCNDDLIGEVVRIQEGFIK